MKNDTQPKYNEDEARHLLHVYLFSLKCATITKGALALKRCIMHSIFEDRDITKDEYDTIKFKIAKRDMVSVYGIERLICGCLETSQNKLSVLTNMEILEMYGLPKNYASNPLKFINLSSKYIRSQLKKTNKIVELV